MAPSQQPTHFLAELYMPRRDVHGRLNEEDRLRLVAERLAASGVPIRYECSVFVPEEETAFYLFEATEPAAVERVLGAVGLEADRISLASVGSESDSNIVAGHDRARLLMAH